MRSRAQRGWVLALASGAVLLFLHGPIGIILLYAFTTDDASYTFPPPGLTARWFGVADADLDLVLPNLRNFAGRNLGFMG